MSGDGVERIYYAGLSLESLAAAVAIALAALPSSPAPVASPPVHEAIGSDPWPPTNVVAVTQSAAATSPADLAEVLENVRAGIEKLRRGFLEHDPVPLELNKACQALTHMTKGR
jgi:hypothetical protein